MAKINEMAVTIRSRNNRELEPTQGVLTHIHWEAADRPKNAVKTFGLWIALTFASAMVPLAHWVLVPALFITTFVLTLEKFRESERGEGGKGECPKCHQTFKIEKGKWQNRLTDTCGQCHDDLEIILQTAN